MTIPDWTSYGITALQGAPVLVGSLASWGKLLTADNCPLRLPVFQRGTAWNEARVELFWDSLARGYPVGTLLVSTTADVASRPLPKAPFEGSTRSAVNDYTTLVIDGQQRCVALKLGFRPWRSGEASRLWLDLVAASQFFRRAPHSPKANPFRLCSATSPWGRRHGARPTLALRRRARAAIGHDLFHDRDLTLEQTFPLQDQPLPVPLADLLEQVVRFPGVSVEQCVELVPTGSLICFAKGEARIPEPLTAEQRAEIEPQARREAIEQLDAAGLEEFLKRLLERLQDPLVACLGTQLSCGEDLIEAFVRVNRQGVALTEAELGMSRSLLN